MSSQFPLVDPNIGSTGQWIQRDFAATSPIGFEWSSLGEKESYDAASSSSSGGTRPPVSVNSPYFMSSSSPQHRHQFYGGVGGLSGRDIPASPMLSGYGSKMLDDPYARDQLPTAQNARIKKGYFEQLAGVGLGVGNLLAENILSHPFVVLRRQCQVNHSGSSYHVTPFTLLPPVLGLQQNQGVLCLWKGVTSCFVVQGLSFATDTILADLLGLPREITQNSDFSKTLRHMVLKSTTFLLMTPFLAATLMETVQSDVASERPGLFDSLKEGLARVLDLFGHHEISRKIPLWILVTPTIAYQLSHYVISGFVHYVTHAAVKKHMLRRPPDARTVFDDFFPDLFAAFSSHLVADAVLFPLETVLHRLYLQGTRTIIDNLDASRSVVPVSTRYEGLFDCIKCIQKGEGWLGFYKGFGALCFQYTVHYAILRLTRVIFERLEDSLRQQQQHNVQRPRLPPPNPNWPAEF